MKSLTIHNIDTKLMQIIERKAKEWDLSLNKTIKKLLKQQLINEPEHKDENPFKAIFGKWTEKDFEAFADNTSFFNEVDEKLWQ